MDIQPSTQIRSGALRLGCLSSDVRVKIRRQLMLPELQTDPKSPDRLLGVVPFGGRLVALSIEPDGSPAEEVMDFASRAVDDLGELDAMARQVAVRNLLPEYNSSWREFVRVCPDGQNVAITEPELGESEFRSRLTLTSLGATGDSSLTLGYGDDSMFAGHSVFVTSFDGMQFADAHAEIFG